MLFHISKTNDLIKLEALVKYISTFLDIPAAIITDPEQDFYTFEKAHCFMPSVQKQLTSDYLFNFTKEKPQDCIFVLNDVFGIYIIIFHVLGHWVILGPYVEDFWSDDDSHICLASLNLPISTGEKYKLYRCSFTVQKKGTVLSHSINFANNFTKFHHVYNVETMEVSHLERITNKAASSSSIKNVESGYSYEKKLFHAIKEGDLNKVQQIQQEITASTYANNYHMKNLRNQTASATIIRTIARKAAEDAGVPIIQLDSISHEYAQKMYAANNSKSLKTLVDFMLEDYAKLVYEYKHQNYSLEIKNIIEYIRQNLNTQMNLTTFTGLTGLSTTTLTTKFKRETGLTINFYINSMRTKKAAELLKNSALTIQEIAYYVGYLDSNYFIKVFKKQYGCTPSAYRKTV